MIRKSGYFSLLFLVYLTLPMPMVYAAVDGGYVFMDVRNREASLDAEGQRFCVNYQQYMYKNIPSTIREAEPLQLRWWNNNLNETDVCITENFTPFHSNDLVPALYRTDYRNTSCDFEPNSDDNFMHYQFTRIASQNASNILFLMDKGKKNVYGIRDFLFTLFYNPEIPLNGSTNVYYIYEQVFYDNILPLLRNKESVELRFYRPAKWFVNPTCVLMLVIAVGCILIGSLWAAKEAEQELEESIVTVPEIVISNENNISVENALPSNENESSIENVSTDNLDTLEKKKRKKERQKRERDETTYAPWWVHMAGAVCFLVFSVTILLLAFFFRNTAIPIFNLLILCFGTISIYACIYHVYKKLFPEVPLFSLSQLFCLSKWAPTINGFKRLIKMHVFKEKIPLVSTLIFCGSLAICSTWYWNRRVNEAMILLDCINVFICVYSIKSSNIRCLQWISFILILMFVYDVVMVFGTKLMTSNGCSVMMQVVTGMDCQNANSTNNYLVPPVDSKFPEKIPILFHLPYLNEPMSECVDKTIDTQLNTMLLGLGDIVLPGFLIAYCFFVDVVKKHRCYKYGFIVLFGYTMGMISTFASLFIMKVGQPALLYLVPFTLIPIVFLSWLDGIFQQVWSGKFPELLPKIGVPSAELQNNL